MDAKLMGIGVKVSQGVIFAIRVCFRSVCNHPFLVGILCFFIFLYRSCPFMFSLLLSASPILVCTAILLGILLSYGEPNIPEIELEESTTHVSASTGIGLSGDANVLEKTGSFSVDGFGEIKSGEQTDLPAGKVGVDLTEGFLDDTATLIKERSLKSPLSDVENWDSEQEFDDSRFKGRVGDVGVSENDYGFVKVNDGLVETDDEKSEAGSFDSEKVNVDSLDSLPRSPWKRLEEEEGKGIGGIEEEHDRDGDEDGFDSDSDMAESSSPDASIADIMPMLDELHPLLDEEASHLVDVGHDGSDAASERSSSTSHNSDDETEHPEDLEAADDEDEEDALTDKDEQTKSAITWTEEDQKNLMDLGSSEMERNQRLENLILRRRARKNISMMPERNLIDLESFDLPSSVAPISTRRQNPFDLANEPCDDSGLPPIPGSAPSVLLPRRNPFDIPYDSGEEKPNLMGEDGLQEELVSFQSREQSMFRRHESFHVGPSIFAPNRQEARMRPYFVPEKTFADDSAYSPFQRELSGLSDSKVSSIPETESLGSVEDMEEKKLSVEDDLLNKEVLPETKEVTDEGPSVDPEIISQVTEDDDVPLIKEVTEEAPSMGEVSEEDVHQTPRLSSRIDSVSEHVGHGSQSSSSSSSSSQDSSKIVPVDTGEVDGDRIQFSLENVPDHVIQPVAIQESGYRSSSSSLSEETERGFTEREIEGSSLLEEQRDVVVEDEEHPVISTRTDLSITSTFSSDDTPHREPVYDSSPRGVSKNLSSSSISSEVLPEDDPGLPPALVNRTVSFDHDIEMLPESCITHPVNESRTIDIDVDVRETEHSNSDSLGVNQRSESEGATAAINLTPDLSFREGSQEENLIDAHRLAEGHHDLDQAKQETLPVSERDVSKRNEQDREEIVQSPESDADLYHEASEKLITTPSAQGNTSLFYDKAIHGPIFRHQNEFKAHSRTPPESSLDIQSTETIDMPQIQELDQDVSSNANSPLSPDFISIPSTVSDINSSHFDVQTVVEEVDQIDEIDEDILSELDAVGDFSATQPDLGSNIVEKHIDTAGVCSSSSAFHAETSSNSTVNVNLVEENKEKDLREEESKIKYGGRDSEEYFQEETSGEDCPGKTEAPHHDSVFNRNIEDTSVKPETRIGSSDYVHSVLIKPELASVEAEIMSVGGETSAQSPVEIRNTSALPELEARTSDQGSVDTKNTSALPERDGEESSQEEISGDDKILPRKTESPPDDPVFNRNVEDNFVKPETEVGSSDYVHPVLKFFELGPEAEILIAGAATSDQDPVDIKSTSGLPELEAATTDQGSVDTKNTSVLPELEAKTSVLGVARTEDSDLDQQTSPVLHNAEQIPTGRDILPPKESVDDMEKQKKPKPDDEPLEIEAEKEISSREKSIEQGNSTSAAEEMNREVGSPQELHSSTKPVERKSKSSGSSSSSSSSDSSSSDSEKE